MLRNRFALMKVITKKPRYQYQQNYLSGYPTLIGCTNVL